MAKQVAGSEKTLLEAIRDGEIERPSLMRWDAWQQWRTRVGRRPHMSVDGYSTTSGQESAMWRATMLELYGTDWAFLLVSADVDRPEEPPPQLSEPSLPPAADARGRERELGRLRSSQWTAEEGGRGAMNAS